MKTVYQVYCEWDIGQDQGVFSTYAKAVDFIKNCDALKDCIDDNQTLEDLWEDGLVGIKPVPVD